MKAQSLKKHGLALLLALLAFGALRWQSPQTGLVRDEAAYIESSLRIRSWLSIFFQDPGRALGRVDRAFAYNHEHPAGIKLLAAFTVQDQGRDRSSLPAQRLRLAAQLLAALGVYLLGLTAMRRYGGAIGLFCGAAFITLPRVFYHAQLHCFDVAIAVATLAVALAFIRFASSPHTRSALPLGLSFAAAVSIKHNAWLLPPLLLVALLWTHYPKPRPSKAQIQSTLAYGALALTLGLALYWLCWPWLWHTPVDRWLEYIDFHRDHSYYNMQFLGPNYNQPPLPWSYPWVITAVTWPLSWICLALGGLALSLRNENDPQTRLEARCDVILALAPLVLISLPSVPIFGGSKHWITAYPFLCLLMGRALFALRWRLAPSWTKYTWLGLLILWSPAFIDTLRSAPHQIAQYAGWFGGPRAAARAGLGRAFWGGVCVPQALARFPKASKVFPHDTHPGTLSAYPNSSPQANSRAKADVAFSFQEAHFLIDEIWTLEAGFSPSPAWVCTLDDVPLMSVYKK